MFGTDFTAFTQKTGTFEKVAQFPDVSRVSIGLQEIHRFVGNGQIPSGSHDFQKGGDQKRNVFQPVSQCRNIYGKNIKPVIKVFSEQAVSGLLQKIVAGCRNDADIRIISATSHNLLKKAGDGLFRKDLYYRLDIFPIYVPALRDRLEDIPLLIASLLEIMAPGRNLTVSDEAMYLLQTYRYPGNVRELRNFLERACLLCESREIRPEHLLIPEPEDGENAPPPLPVSPEARLKQLLPAFSGKRKALAKMLGISERTLYRRLSELQEKENR